MSRPHPRRDGERHFHREKRSDETTTSTADLDARLTSKSNDEGAKPAFTAHLLIENRYGLAAVRAGCMFLSTGAEGQQERQPQAGPFVDDSAWPPSTCHSHLGE